MSALKRVKHAIERRISPRQDGPSFRGSFGSYEEAMAAVKPGLLAGYDHAEIADISFERMCQVQVWDYPVLFWLARLLPSTARLLDAGGHMGTKFRAFRPLLSLPEGFDWAVYDVPAIVRAGRVRAERDGLSGISFYERIEDAPAAEVLLCSGLLQYLDIPFAELLARMPKAPEHLVLNKVATREGPTVVTLEGFGAAEVPYQVRDRAAFVDGLAALGYDIIDSWAIPDLSRSNPAFGDSTSRGYYARKRP